MLRHLCFVLVKKAEKMGVLAAGVCRDGSQWDCFGSLFSFAWQSKKIWFPGHDNLRSHARPPPPLSQSLLIQHIDTSMQANTHRAVQSRPLAGPFCCGEERCYLTVPSSIPLVIIVSLSLADLNLSCIFPSVHFFLSLFLPRCRSHWEPLVPRRATSTRDRTSEVRLLCSPSTWEEPVLPDWNTFLKKTPPYVHQHSHSIMKLHKKSFLFISKSVKAAFITHFTCWNVVLI